MKKRNLIVAGLLALPLLAACNNSGIVDKGSEVTRDEVLNTIESYDDTYEIETYSYTSAYELNLTTTVTIGEETQTTKAERSMKEEMAVDIKEEGNYYAYQSYDNSIKSEADGETDSESYKGEMVIKPNADGTYTATATVDGETSTNEVTEDYIMSVAVSSYSSNRLTESTLASLEASYTEVKYYKNGDGWITIEGQMSLSSVIGLAAETEDKVTMTAQYEPHGYMTYQGIPETNINISIEVGEENLVLPMNMSMSATGTMKAEYKLSYNGSISRK